MQVPVLAVAGVSHSGACTGIRFGFRAQQELIDAAATKLNC